MQRKVGKDTLNHMIHDYQIHLAPTVIAHVPLSESDIGDTVFGDCQIAKAQGDLSNKALDPGLSLS